VFAAVFRSERSTIMEGGRLGWLAGVDQAAQSRNLGG